MPDPCVSAEDTTGPSLGRAASPAGLSGQWADAGDAAQREDGGRKSRGPAHDEAAESRTVRVEANFLRLPLFALDNKHMRTMDGIRCEGTFRRSGKTFAFTYVATRNARTLYPGPVARSAHFAILSFATERGLPVRNPIVFTWRELCARMNIRSSGKTIRELKEAMLATKGLMIESQHALYAKAEDKPLDTADEVDRVVGLYDELEFFGTKRQDGTEADVNAVWLSRWYLENLNALYSGPLDYDLWRRLNDRSPIASRLYEFLFFKFYGGREILRFNYPNLVKFIPARTERYASDAKKQLNPAFALLQDAGILRRTDWVESRGGAPQVLLSRGGLLDATGQEQSAGYDVGEEDFVLRQIEDLRLPEWQVVADFHQRWGHENYRPSKAELELARELIAKYGTEQLRELIPPVVKRMQAKWPEAKTFVAVGRYIDDVAGEYRHRQRLLDLERQEVERQRQEREAEAKRAADRATLKILWEGLPAAEQEEIRTAVIARQPQRLRDFPGIVENFCLEELARRQAADSRG
jgi:hypothetical protein